MRTGTERSRRLRKLAAELPAMKRRLIDVRMELASFDETAAKRKATLKDERLMLTAAIEKAEAAAAELRGEVPLYE